MDVNIAGRRIGNMVEAIHVEKPSERAYLAMEDFDTMRGQALEDYVDDHLKIYGEQAVEKVDVFGGKKRKKKDEQVGAQEPIKSIAFDMTAAEYHKKYEEDEESSEEETAE